MRWRRLVASSAALSVLLWAVVAQAQTRVVTADLFRLNTGPCVLRSGSGSPEGAVTGNPCDHYLRTDQPELWEKKTGTETTGWQKAGFVGTLASTDLTDSANLPRLNLANTYINNQIINVATASAFWWYTQNSNGGALYGISSDGKPTISLKDGSAVDRGIWIQGSASTLAATIGGSLAWGGGSAIASSDDVAILGTLASTDLTDTANLARLNAANSFLLINPLTTLAESWIGPSSTTGIYFKAGNVGIGTTTPIGVVHSAAGSATNVDVLASENTDITSNTTRRLTQLYIGRDTVGNRKTIGTVYAKVDQINANDGSLHFGVRTGNTLDEEVMVLKAGNVGIGTTTPTLFKLQTAGDVGPDAHSTYDLGLTGTRWRAGYFSYLSTDELHAKAFTADIEQALVGGQIIAKSVVVVAAAFTLPAQGASTTFIVEDIANMAAVDVFVAGDFVRFRQFTRGVNTLDVADAWGTISATGHTHNGDGTQTWTFVRSATPDEGTATGTITRGQLVIDYGVSGDGLIEATVLDGSGQANAPYARYLTWTSHPKTGQVVRTQIGNLNGITSTAEFGLLAGTYAATSGQYFRASDQHFELHGIDLSLWDGATKTVYLDHATPALALGNPLPTAYGTGAGIWMGKDTTYKFRVGDPAGGQLAWDGSTLKAAGWTIGATALMDTAGVVGMSSAVTGGDDIRFWAGHATPASAPFRVTEAGLLTAMGATLGGSLIIDPDAGGDFLSANGVTWVHGSDDGDFGVAATYIADTTKTIYGRSVVGTDMEGAGLIDLYARSRETTGAESRLYGRLRLGSWSGPHIGYAELTAGDSLSVVMASVTVGVAAGVGGINLTSTGGTTIEGLSIAPTTGALTWGGDTNLYRLQANYLATDDIFYSMGGAVMVGGADKNISLETQASDGYQSAIRLYQTNHGNWYIYNPAHSSDLRFFESSGDRLVLTSAGVLSWGGGTTISSSSSVSQTGHAHAATDLTSGTLDDARLSANVMFKNVALGTTTSADYPVVWSSGNNLHYYKTDGYNSGVSGAFVTSFTAELGIVTDVGTTAFGESTTTDCSGGCTFTNGLLTGYAPQSVFLARLDRLERENATLWAELTALRALLAKEMR